MISSIINGKKILSHTKTNYAYGIDGEKLDTVCVFNDSIEQYVPELHTVFNHWKKTTIPERLNTLVSIKTIFQNEQFSNKLVDSICKEIGKPLNEAETEVSESIALIDFFLDNITSETFISKVEIDPYYETKNNYIKLCPIGIVGIIKPWNYPLTNSLWSILPAILAGNIVIYKPSEYCCYTANILAEAFINSNLPRGVFNILFGDDITGQRLVECKEISMISFTGSTDTAIEIQKKSADFGIIRKFSLETGGSDFAIIDKVIDMDFTINGVIWGAFNNSGQVCTSIENVLVPIEIYSDFTKKLINKIHELRPKKDYGKLQNAALTFKTQKYLNRIVQNPLTNIVTGGYIRDNFLMPTLIECEDFSEINVEVFSNILRIFKYSSEMDIPKIINSSKFGLGCSIWTAEPHSPRINQLIDDLNVGMIWINDVNVSFPEMPWGGVKNSGVGFNLSVDSIKEFSSLKSISIDSNWKINKEWWYPYEN